MPPGTWAASVASAAAASCDLPGVEPEAVLDDQHDPEEERRDDDGDLRRTSSPRSVAGSSAGHGRLRVGDVVRVVLGGGVDDAHDDDGRTDEQEGDDGDLGGGQAPVVAGVDVEPGEDVVTTESCSLGSEVVMVGPPSGRFASGDGVGHGGDLLDGRVGDEDEEAEEQDGDGDRHALGGRFGRGFGLGDLVAAEGVGLGGE